MPRRPSYLTETQKAILEFIEEFQDREGIAPTHREICERFGYSSYGTAYKHLKLLAEKGFLRRDWNQKRGLELVKPIPGRRGSAARGGGSEAGSGASAGHGAEIPFFGRVAAGQPIEAVAGPETLEVPAHLLASGAAEHYVLRVAGDSMIDEGIHDGDWVVVQRRERADPGEMVVALVADEAATLKRFYPEGDVVRLQPSHPGMSPIRVPAKDVRVQGVVVGLMRRF